MTTVWHRSRNDKISFKTIFWNELSNTVFSFTSAKHSRDRGRVKASTPGRRWKIHRPSKAYGFNTRTGGGGAKYVHASDFSRIAEKRWHAEPSFFQYLLTIELDTLCKNFNPRSPKVRSPGQVTIKNGILTLRLRSGHTRYPIGLTLASGGGLMQPPRSFFLSWTLKPFGVSRWNFR